MASNNTSKKTVPADNPNVEARKSPTYHAGDDKGVMERYRDANLEQERGKITILAMLGFVGLGGLHRFYIAAKAKDPQQAFLGAIYLLPTVLVGLLIWTKPPGVSIQWWYFAPLALTYILTLFDLVNMKRLLSGEMSAKKAWYESWPGRIGAIIILPVGLYLLYTKTNLPKKQKDSIASILTALFIALMGASFTGVQEAQTQAVNQQAAKEGKYANCDAVRAANVKTPIPKDSPDYAPWLDRDSDGLACE